MVIDELIRGDEIIPILAIILGFVIAFISVTGGLMVALVKAWRGGGRKRSNEMDAEEARAFQEMQRGFQRMEDRVESLETLIIDQSREETIKN